MYERLVELMDWNKEREMGISSGVRIDSGNFQSFGTWETTYLKNKDTDWKDYEFIHYNDFIKKYFPKELKEEITESTKIFVGFHNKSNKINNNKTMNEEIKRVLKQIPATLKRVLNKDLQAQYKADFRNGDLALTSEGKDELLDILAKDNEEALSARAKEVIAEVEKENAKK